MNDPAINRTEKTGHPYKLGPYIFEPLYNNVCGACNKYEAEVKFKGAPLCSGCALEEKIEIL